MANFLQYNLALEERLDKHGSRLYKLENLNISHQVSKVVNVIVTNAVDWAMQAPLCACFNDMPAVDMKEILQQRMFEDKSYEAHEDHKKLYDSLEKSSECSRVAGLSSLGSSFHQSFLESAFDVVQAIDCGAEVADLDELGASLPLPGAPDAPAGGGGGGGYGGGDPKGVLVRHVSFFSSGELLSDLIGVSLSNHTLMTSPANHTTSCNLHEPHRIYLQTSVVG
nr:hypothetical protein [Tanacetum cinerariifolium]